MKYLRLGISETIDTLLDIANQKEIVMCDICITIFDQSIVSTNANASVQQLYQPQLKVIRILKLVYKQMPELSPVFLAHMFCVLQQLDALCLQVVVIQRCVVLFRLLIRRPLSTNKAYEPIAGEMRGSFVL